MKKINNETGNTLLLALVIIVLFSILGLTLTSLATSGILKNDIRENTVQAQDLSDKGSEFLINDINQFLTKEVARGTYGKDAFLNLLVTTLSSNSYKCPADGVKNPYEFGVTIPGENESKTNVCIKGPIRMVSNEEKDLYKREVDIISTGIVDGKQHKTKVTAIIGTDAVPDQLRYALSTNDEGNLYLHGGVEIQGDIKTDGHLVLSDRATWISGSNAIWQPSVRATILKDTKSATPKLIMREKDNKNSSKNKYVYVLNNKNVDYEKHINGSLLNNGDYAKIDPNDLTKHQSITDSFFLSNTLKVATKTLPPDTIDIINKIKLGYKNAEKKATFTIDNDNPDGGKFNKDQIIYIGKQESCKSGSSCENGTKYTKGNLSIEKKTSYWWSYPTPTINLRGTYYIDGNLNIDNVNLKSDAIIYVSGSVNITESTIQGMTENSTLLIFSEGPINISNISVDSKIGEGSMIKGFFYSKSNLIMYGVGSNITLKGGISAKRLILTAVRGKASRNSYDTAETQAKLKSDGTPLNDSRLNIIYDENIISEYTSFKRDEEEEFITQISDPVIINRTN